MTDNEKQAVEILNMLTEATPEEYQAMTRAIRQKAETGNDSFRHFAAVLLDMATRRRGQAV